MIKTDTLSAFWEFYSVFFHSFEMLNGPIRLNERTCAYFFGIVGVCVCICQLIHAQFFSQERERERDGEENNMKYIVDVI